LKRLRASELRLLLSRNNELMSEQTEPAKTFEAGLEELEQIVKQMESGDLTLERALALFERGVRLSDECRKQLEDAETRVETLVRRGDKVTPELFHPEK
jgi:exodeoxyribonuclease VII small subunit